MRSHSLRFDNGRGHELAARLDLPDRRPLAYALLAHCFTCGKNLNATSQVARSLVDGGLAVLRFDFTGLGDSEGELADTDFSGNVEDVIAAARFLEREHAAPQLLVGHSLGGSAVLLAAGSLPSVRAVATIGAPSHPEHVARLLGSARAEIEATGRAEVELAGRRFTITRRFLDDLAEQPMHAAIASLGRALLVLHAPGDAIVGIDSASRIFQAAKHPKSFVSLDGADHLLEERRDTAFVGSLIAAWASRYVEQPPPAAAVPAEGEDVLVRGPSAGYRTELVAGGHPLVADEPVALGGGDAGPGPYALVLAGLGACTAMTLRMYADRKGWPLERADVQLRHGKVHARDCAAASEAARASNAMIDRIERRLRLHGPLDATQRARLRELADRCPVHRTLTSEICIETTVEEES
jgi:putative redox protein